MGLKVIEFQTTLSGQWDEFIARSHQATFLHSRKFLSYHGDKFKDRSVILADDRQWIAVFPAAEDLADRRRVISHPGATYGGLVQAGDCVGEIATESIEVLINHYKNLGFEELIFKIVPSIYHRQPYEDDAWALNNRGAQIFRSDLSTALNLKYPSEMSERRKRSLKKAGSAGLKFLDGASVIERFWPVLESSLQSRHQVKPVHSAAEMIDLMKRFPNEIRASAAELSGQISAGLVSFVSPRVWHLQYSVASPEGFKISALDALIDRAIQAARRENIEFFDFGVSTENQGKVLNDGLYGYKSEFGGGGFVYDHYRLEISRRPAL